MAVCFCGPIRQVAPSRVLPGTALYGVRTFLDPAKQSRDHPTDPGQGDDNRFVRRSQPALERLESYRKRFFVLGVVKIVDQGNP